jgi:DNA primase
MRKFQNEALDELDIEFVLAEEGIDYKMAWGRSGQQLNVRTCPFCGNDKYKVYLNAETALGNCFAGSCSQGTFNKWQYLHAVFGGSTAETLAKINVMAINQGWRPKVKFEKADPGPLLLPPSTPVQDLPALPKYLRERGISTAVAAHFGLRLCEAGTFEVQTPDGRTQRQDYANRIIIPIHALDGTLVSFQGRDITGTSEKRYLFPPMFASTGSQIYNVQNWEHGMRAIVLGEGPFDAIGIYKALQDAMLDHTMLAAASFGMSFSVSNAGQDDQINRLLELKAQGLEDVYFMWDNEPEALKKAVNAAVQVTRYGLRAYVCKLEESKDPGDASVGEIQTAIKLAYPVTTPLAAMLLLRRLIP